MGRRAQRLMGEASQYRAWGEDDFETGHGGARRRNGGGGDLVGSGGDRLFLVGSILSRRLCGVDSLVTEWATAADCVAVLTPR